MMAVAVVMAALAPLVFMVASKSPALMGVWMALYIAVGVIAALGAFFFERSKKSKANSFSKSVEQNASSTEGVKDPNKLAQIDHMRKEFQRGIDIYKRYGKDLYSLPWYVVVGESGSGKTEALRRSEMGFPEKLQDRWQGSGGTLSMHWWFTNKAVILDTAGRLFVQDGSDTESTQSQWVSFLQMLRKNRPDCPINGLILVIPATRLVANEDPEIEAESIARLDRNTGQISRQMETLQSELGIRFPVYILISKTDKITGFREFFSSIEKADERYQMLGWSNPAPLGEPFNPQSVADYIKSVADRLKRRMMTGLRNPAPADGDGLRINEVDAVYSFPTAFASMAPKLTRYLRQVFSSDEWSSRPPFLRGIYFTSALQQGKVLDEAIAKAMGIPLQEMENDSGEEGFGLSKHRTYFIRDLFLEKVFREKGLVTKSDKVKASVSGWKLWLPACFVIGLGLFALLGWFTSRPGTESERWRELLFEKSDVSGRALRPLATITQSGGKPTGKWSDTRVLEILKQLATDVQGRPKFGWIFVPAQWFDRSLTDDRRETYGHVVAHASADLIAEVHKALEGSISESPTPRQWKALNALLAIKHGQIKGADLLVPGSDEKESVPLIGRIADLLGFLDMVGNDTDKHRVAALSEVMVLAAAMPSSGFDEEFRRLMDAVDLKTVVTKALAPGGVTSGDFIRQVNDLAENRELVLKTLGRSGSADQDKVFALRDSVVELLARHADSISRVRIEEPAADGGEGEEDASGEKTVRNTLKQLRLNRVTEYPSLDEQEGGGLSSAAKRLLADDARLLKDTRLALLPDLADDSAGFSPGDIDALIQHFAKDAPENSAANLPLRKWWAKEYFYPEEFGKYVRFPLVADAKPATDEEIYVLLRLVELSRTLEIKSDAVQAVHEVANGLFDLTKLSLRRLASATRKCSIRPRGTLQPLRVEVLDGSGRLVAEFDTRVAAEPRPAEGVAFDASLSFKVEGVQVGATGKPWDLVRWRLNPEAGNQQWCRTVRHSNGVGMVLEIVPPEGVELPEADAWPRLEDFTSQP